MEYKRKRLIRAAWQKAEAKRKQTVRQSESAADTEQQTPEEYAQTVVSEKAAQAAENLQSKALDTGRISYRQFRILQEKRQRVPTTHAAQPAETENTPLGQSADKRETFKRQRFRQKALDKQEIKTPDSYRDKMQALKRQHLTRETVRRHAPHIARQQVGLGVICVLEGNCKHHLFPPGSVSVKVAHGNGLNITVGDLGGAACTVIGTLEVIAGIYRHRLIVAGIIERAAEEHQLLCAAPLAVDRNRLHSQLLPWAAVDFEQNTIEICHTVTTVRLDGKEVLVESNGTKTKSSKRTLPLVPVFREQLLALQEEQKENRKLCGRCYNKKYADYICVDAMGNLLKPDYLSNSFQIILQNYHLRRIRFHDLRHSCASLLLANGVPMKMIQEWLGHSDFSTTANIYSHLDYASKVSSAEAMLNGLGMGSNPENDT